MCLSLDCCYCHYLCFSFCFVSTDQVRTQQSTNTCETKFEHVRFPIKPRTMAQVQIPADISADADITPLEKCKSER